MLPRGYDFKTSKLTVPNKSGFFQMAIMDIPVTYRKITRTEKLKLIK